jgi:hypothetical protein
LSEEKEEQLYNAVLELSHVRKVAFREFPCLRKIDCGMLKKLNLGNEKDPRSYLLM